jgi:hypothetical protein
MLPEDFMLEMADDLCFSALARRKLLPCFDFHQCSIYINKRLTPVNHSVLTDIL